MSLHLCLVATVLILNCVAPSDAGGQSFPTLGKPAPAAAAEQMENGMHVMIMSSPSQLYRSFVLSGPVKWDLGVSADGIVKYVSTKDPKFRTPEGISVAMKYSEVRKRAKAEAMKFPGWAWVVELPSGWKAAFVRGRYMTEEPLEDSTPICFFYRSE